MSDVYGICLLVGFGLLGFGDKWGKVCGLALVIYVLEKISS